ncbi:hypothetical protein FOZ63_028842 [Perkinsus olseni]|uniref:Uncharacterized protein n=1 Tax=Perkinsus olseni TaxID=32597 RepID=A0A7J6QR96_PEROL|nr:hypothetical protein FOZ63_028842 [Perkinsus olseni]
MVDIIFVTVALKLLAYKLNPIVRYNHISTPTKYHGSGVAYIVPGSDGSSFAIYWSFHFLLVRVATLLASPLVITVLMSLMYSHNDCFHWHRLLHTSSSVGFL